MRPTTRGWAALAILAAAAVLAAVSGARALNAVAAPILTALAVGAVQVFRAEAPTVTVEPPRPGFPGEHRRFALTIEGRGLATVSLPLPEGVVGRHLTGTVDLPATVERTVTLERRGVHELGAVRIRQRGPLGLIARTLETEAAGTAVVYPSRYTVADPEFAALFEDDTIPERQEFDRLREYVPGDPLRNVHWKSSAKYDDFLVMEFDETDRDETVTVEASATEGHADRMASAVATVVEVAMAAGQPVAVAVPGGTVDAGHGDSHREEILRLLARTGAGPSPPVETPEVVIEADDGGTTVTVGDRSFDFEALTAGRRIKPAAGTETAAEGAA
jgi:uncharacterized protein (DUF58 family)